MTTLVLRRNKLDDLALCLPALAALPALTRLDVSHNFLRRLHGNGAITPAVREQLHAPAMVRQGLGCHFNFDDTSTGSVFDQEGNVVPELK